MSDSEAQRPTAQKIFERARDAGEEELERPASQLFFSGIAGGTVMGLSGTGVAVLLSEGVAGPWAYLLYPVGFIAVILGRMQLFTENTLFPVLVTLSRRGHLLRMLRLWGLVLLANVLGALLFASLFAGLRAGEAGALSALTAIGEKVGHQPFGRVLSDAIIGGWLIALVAWLVSSANSMGGQVIVIYLVTFVVGAGKFDHSIAGLSEVMVAAWQGKLAVAAAARWFLAAVLGNVLGGVGLVSLLNYGQVFGRKRAEA